MGTTDREVCVGAGNPRGCRNKAFWRVPKHLVQTFVSKWLWPIQMDGFLLPRPAAHCFLFQHTNLFSWSSVFTLRKPSALVWGLQSQNSLPPWNCKEQFHLCWVAVTRYSVVPLPRLEGESRKDTGGTSKTTSNPLSWTHCSTFPWITRRSDWVRGCCGTWLMLTNVKWDFKTL